MGRLHARVFAQLGEDFSLVGVFDPDAEAAHEAALSWSVEAFEGESEAVAAADLVVVASPIEAHVGAARRALARGRHLLVEKPLCATAAQAFGLARSLGRGQRLFVGHSERYNPVVRALRAILRPGEIRTLRLRRTSAVSRAGRERGALISLGVHDIDLAAYLTSSPVALREALHVDDDRADLVLGVASGAVAWVHVDRCAERRERLIEIVTEDAVYSGDLLERTLTVRRLATGTSTACELVDEEALVAQARAIARALAGSEEEVASGVDGARALLVVEQASQRTGVDRSLALGA
jgi:predicted dehydrogenase